MTLSFRVEDSKAAARAACVSLRVALVSQHRLLFELPPKLILKEDEVLLLLFFELLVLLVLEDWESSTFLLFPWKNFCILLNVRFCMYVRLVSSFTSSYKM